MDAFGDDDFSASNADTDFNGSAEVDPAADFLAREHDQLAGLEEDIIPESETAAAAPNIQGNEKTHFLLATQPCLLLCYSDVCTPLPYHKAKILENSRDIVQSFVFNKSNLAVLLFRQ